MRLRATLVLLLGLLPATAHAAGVEAAGTDIAIAMPLIAGGIALYKDDAIDRRHGGHARHRLCAEEIRP
jgi:hypothetical protein